MAPLRLLVCLTILIYSVQGFLFKSNKCYDDLGCFGNGYPFNNALHEIPDSPDDIKTSLTLYTRTNPIHGQVLSYKDRNSIENSNFNPKLNTKILIHGYLSDGEAPFLIQMTKDFLLMEDMNVIVINWKEGAHKLYPKSVANTRIVGAIIAQFILDVKDGFKANPASFHIIGHSLGAHISGYIGSRVENIGRITGLDPAGPLFEGSNKRVRLDAGDANFVDCIHSDGLPLYDLGLGTTDSWGDIDFYPNGAGNQPGCPKPISGGLKAIFSLQFHHLKADVACSHHRAISYFLESLKSNSTCKFTAYPCSSYHDVKKGYCNNCGNGACPIMGYHSIDSNRTGKFYLSTNGQSPFCSKLSFNSL